ncbi:MAG: hypothetical protein ACKV2V_01620 [Blastocatellia bacterium]
MSTRALSFLFMCGWLASQIIPVHGQIVNPDSVVVVSAASFSRAAIATDSLATAFGTKLATATASATDIDPRTPGIQLPTSLAGTTVTVNGALAPLLFVSPGQVNFVVPAVTNPLAPLLPDAPPEIVITAADGVASPGTISLAPYAPGLFNLDVDGARVPAGFLIITADDGTLRTEPLLERDSRGALVIRPIRYGRFDARFHLILFLTGIRHAPDPNADGNRNESVRVLLNGYSLVPSFAGRQADFAGLDQINVEIPRGLFGKPIVSLSVSVNDEVYSNELSLFSELPALTTVNWVATALTSRVNAVTGDDEALIAGTDRHSIFQGQWRDATAVNLPAGHGHCRGQPGKGNVDTGGASIRRAGGDQQPVHGR